jgi:hypothetical protein
LEYFKWTINPSSMLLLVPLERKLIDLMFDKVAVAELLQSSMGFIYNASYADGLTDLLTKLIIMIFW